MESFTGQRVNTWRRGTLGRTECTLRVLLASRTRSNCGCPMASCLPPRIRPRQIERKTHPLSPHIVKQKRRPSARRVSAGLYGHPLHSTRPLSLPSPDSSPGLTSFHPHPLPYSPRSHFLAPPSPRTVSALSLPVGPQLLTLRHLFLVLETRI